MSVSASQRPDPMLSICITTLNRAAFIGATLASILAQATDECEVVVLDGGSTDDTERVVSDYSRRFRCLRYVRQATNNGFDRDCDRAVALARGEYCWLMTDDDLFKQGAVAAVLKKLQEDVSLVIVNVEVRDLDLSSVLQGRGIDLQSDRVFGPGEMNHLVEQVGDLLAYMGCIVIKRTIWLARESERYYGSLFTYLGVIFQDPLPGAAVVIAEPCVSYRRGNEHTFSSRMFETFMIKFPAVVWSLALSEAAKSKICHADPWRNARVLVIWRGRGLYSLSEFRQFIRPRLGSAREGLVPAFVAVLPGVLTNALLITYYSLTRRRYRGMWDSRMMLYDLRESRFYRWNWWAMKWRARKGCANAARNI